MAEIAYQMA